MEKIGAVAVIGGGIAGVQAATDLAEAGYKVYIIESSSSIGGVMAQLDKTFPTNDCSMCILSPKLVQAGRHSNISIITLAQVQKLEGNPGDFDLTLLKKARYIDEDKCNGCGICGQECPVEAIDFFNEGLSLKNAASVSFPQAVPLLFSINREICIGCGICEAVCKAHAINYADTDEELKLKIGAIILAIGFDEFEPESYTLYGYKRFPNVITSIEFERILSASGPYTGHVLRPSDGEIPEKIAFIQCVGSRDCVHGKSYCSAVCCMYTAKEAVIAKEHQHEVNPTIFTMDIRAVGKDFDKYIDRAQNEYGIRFIRSRIAAVEEDPDTHNLSLTYETITGEICTEEFHMVVLAVGINPPKSAKHVSQVLGFELNKYGFCKTLPFSLEETTKPGIFVCGAFAAPKDIPESVVQASAAAGNVNLLLSSVKGSLITKKVYPEEIKVEGTSPRIGVFICHCGINIAGVVDVPAVLDFVEDLPNVVYAERNLYTCSADTQTKIKEKIQEHNLNRVVIASCTPRTHEPLFQETLREAGLNPYLYQMTNIRDQCSWVHIKEPKAATEKAKDLVEMAIKRVRYHEPLQELALQITPKALIIGGGVSGMTAALNLAQQGYQTYLIEQENQLGGFSNQLIMTLEGENIQEHLSSLKTAIQNEPLIEIFTDTSILEVSGYLGNFKTKIIGKSSQKKKVLDHGIIITATGAKEYIPTEFSYGTDSRVVTQREMEKLLHATEKAKNLKIIAMVQCVG
ncbi:MAG: CoB--CoM heterodisulfide reductase iron-sulfur subunit A family protein, partial [Promethearchaeota archaeon]